MVSLCALIIAIVVSAETLRGDDTLPRPAGAPEPISDPEEIINAKEVRFMFIRLGYRDGPGSSMIDESLLPLSGGLFCARHRGIEGRIQFFDAQNVRLASYPVLITAKSCRGLVAVLGLDRPVDGYVRFSGLDGKRVRDMVGRYVGIEAGASFGRWGERKYRLRNSHGVVLRGRHSRPGLGIQLSRDVFEVMAVFENIEGQHYDKNWDARIELD